MYPGRVSNPGPLTYESGALPTALRGPATLGRDQCMTTAEVSAATDLYILRMEGQTAQEMTFANI